MRPANMNFNHNTDVAYRLVSHVVILGRQNLSSGEKWKQARMFLTIEIKISVTTVLSGLGAMSAFE